jgi:hypothetical protein
LNVHATKELNGYMDGHFVVETYTSGAWRMWDLTNGRYFVDAVGNHMSTAALISQLSKEGAAFPTAVRLDTANHSSSSASVGVPPYDYGLFGEIFLNPTVNLEAWYRHVFENGEVFLGGKMAAECGTSHPPACK